MTHYLMVAKLSKKCFDLVLEIPQRINRKVTQGDFIHLYNKSEEEQHKVLSDLLNNRISFQDVKRRKVNHLNCLKTNVHRHNCLSCVYICDDQSCLRILLYNSALLIQS